MRKMSWVCDKCGREIDLSLSIVENSRVLDENDDDSEEKTIEELADGWTCINIFKNNKCITVDICPECSNKFTFN